MIVIGSCKCAEVPEFRIELGGNGIWVYHNDGYFSATPDDWREIIKQVSALLPATEHFAGIQEIPVPVDGVIGALDPLGEGYTFIGQNTPDPRGYVFVDQDGDAWGWEDSFTNRGCRQTAERPFLTRRDAEFYGKSCAFKCHRVEVWTPECGVPPMPETQP